MSRKEIIEKAKDTLSGNWVSILFVMFLIGIVSINGSSIDMASDYVYQNIDGAPPTVEVIPNQNAANNTFCYSVY